MDLSLRKPVRASDLSGETLYGNDFDDETLRAWLADEERGFFELHHDQNANSAVADDHRAMNRAHGAWLRDCRYPVTLMLGCADGTDFLGLGIDTERIIAIEPARDWWRDRIGSVPAEFCAPTLRGDIELPDASVDLVVCLGVLHHIANVEYVIAELARVLKPNGRMLVREPIVSMGDFRRPRPGLTLRERGIPRRLMRAFHQSAGLRIVAERPCSCQAIRFALRMVGVEAYAHPWGVRLDSMVGRLTAWLTPYWRDRPWKKLGPSSVMFFAEKTEPS